MTPRAPLASLALALLAAPAEAQSMPGMDMRGTAMPGMTMPAKPAMPAKASVKTRKPAQRRKAPVHAAHGHAPPSPARPAPIAHDSHAAAPLSSAPAGMDDMAAMPGMDHGAVDHAGMDGMPMDHATMGHDMPMSPAARASGTDLPAGTAPPPPVPADHYADRTYPATAMDHARMAMMKEEGGRPFYKLMVNLAEAQTRAGRDGYRWEGEGWFGGDMDRFTLKSEGEGTHGRGVEAAEVQALYSRALDPWWNLQAGVRYDVRPNPSRGYATLGIEGLAPYGFEAEAALFLSDRGDLLARAEGWYDQRITRRLVLQPRVELNFAAQDVPRDRYGAGLVDAELGLRLRYEIAREFAPYVGVSWDRKTGRSAAFARADGDRASAAGLVTGVRFWF